MVQATTTNKARQGGGAMGRMRPRGPRRDRGDEEFEQRVVELSRVTRVMGGGKRMRFRALVVIGNRKGKVGVGLAKGADVSLAVEKATNQARKSMVTVPLKGDTLPHEITVKYKSARVMMRPAPTGTGIIAGGPVRVVLELAHVPNVVSKIQGSANKVNNVRAVFKAFGLMKR